MDETPQISICTVLAFDGGGVRGLSSLLIFQSLMQHINTAIERARSHAGEAHDPVKPQDIFSFFAGTSTGGLIAIMLGKLGMSLDECIVAYRQLAKDIFQKKRGRSRISGGLTSARYSAKRLVGCTERLMEDYHVSTTARMASNADPAACAVVCREHIGLENDSEFKREPVVICSLPCHAEVNCLISEAVRATSAALTYFKPQKIGNRLFSDGGLAYNNPSQAIYDHYYSESHRSDHGNLSFRSVRIINIGTGTKTEQLLRSRSGRNTYVPRFYRTLKFVKRTLTEAAVDPEQVAGWMSTLAEVSNSPEKLIKFERFSADNGVCFIKLDKYKMLQRVEELTRLYLENSQVDDRLEVLAKDIAQEYLEKHRPEPAVASPNEVDHAASTNLPSLAQPSSSSSTPQTVPVPTPRSPEDGADGRPSINENSDIDTQAVHDILNSRVVESLSSQSGSPNSDAGHNTLGAMISQSNMTTMP